MPRFRLLMPMYNLEGDIGGAQSQPEETPQAQESPSVAADQGTGTAPAPAAEPDVSQQESFARRLKEERSKLEQDYQPYKQHSTELERIAKQAGFGSTDEYLSALSAHVKEQAAAQEAQRMGIDPDTYREFFEPVHSQLNQYQSELNTLRQSEAERRVMADLERLRTTHADFTSVQDQVLDVAAQRNLPLEDAYKLVVFDNRIAAAKQEGQIAALAAIKANGQSSPGAAGGDAPDQAFDFTKLSPEQRQQYYQKAKRGELKSLR